MHVGAHVHAYGLVSVPPVQMEPQCSWSQRRERKGRPGEEKGCSLRGGYSQTKHPSGLWLQPRDALGRGGVRAVLEHRRPWDGRAGGRPCSQHVLCRTPPSSPPQGLPVHTWEGSTLAHVWRRGQGTGGDSWVCLQATQPLGSVTLGNAGSWDVQPFQAFCKDEMRHPASRSAHVQGQQDQPPCLLCSSRGPASHRPHRCV